MLTPSSRGAREHVAEFGAANEAGFLRLAVLPFPAGIATDQASKTSDEARRIVGRAIRLCRPRWPGHALQGVADAELSSLADECRALLSRAAPGDAPCPLRDEELAFDRFFGMARHPSTDAFALGIVWGILAMLHEVNRPHSLVPAEMTALTTGYFELARPFLPHGDDGSGREEASAGPRPAPRAEAAIERWKNGHLMFVSLTDGLILAHRRAISALGRDDAAEAGCALHDCSSLFAASAAAMRLTGDMEPREYEEVRAIMSPPRVPEGFSGLFNADHRQLLGVTKPLGALLRQPPAQLAWSREAYWQALNDAYAAHRWVCQRLVNEAPSLIGTTHGSARPAHEKLERFAKRALYFAGCVKSPAQ